MTEAKLPSRIYIDADACPVKDEIYRVASRHGIPVMVQPPGFPGTTSPLYGDIHESVTFPAVRTMPAAA